MTVLAAFLRSLFSPARAPRSACGNSCAFRGKGIMLTDTADPKTLSDAPVQNSNASPTHRSPAEGPLPHPAIPGPQATWDRGACRPPADDPSPAPRDRGRPLPSEKLWVLLCALARPVDSRPRLGERFDPDPSGRVRGHVPGFEFNTCQTSAATPAQRWDLPRQGGCHPSRLRRAETDGPLPRPTELRCVERFFLAD